MHAIMERSSEQNVGPLVTGILVNVDQYFVEVLETSTENLSKILKQIMNNPAHANLVVKSICAINRRSFKSFPKKGCFVLDIDSDFMDGFIVHNRFNPYDLDTEALTEFALEVPKRYANLTSKELGDQALSA